MLLQLLLEIARTDQVAILVSTHDLELAARSSDTVWVAAPCGSIESGGPEDLVSSGRLCAPFACEGIEFDAETLGFVSVGAERPTAAVKADGHATMLAAHALRRAGYRLADPGDRGAIEVARTRAGAESPDADAWTLRHNDTSISLSNLDEVSRHARRLLQVMAEPDPTAVSTDCVNASMETGPTLASGGALRAVDA